MNFGSNIQFASDGLMLYAVEILQKSVQGASTVVETLYRNKSSLEAIFRIIDKDNSGYISLDELADACNLIKEHMPCNMTEEQLSEICRMMDINKDGLVDLNEFLETFRMVDPVSKKKNMPNSPEYSSITTNNRSPKPGLKVSEGSPKVVKSPGSNHTKENGDKNNIFVEAAKAISTGNAQETNETDAVTNQDSLSPSNQGEKFSLKVQVHNFNSNQDVIESGDGSLRKNGLMASPVLSSRRGSQI